MSAIRLLQQTEQQINKLLRVMLIQLRGKGTAFFGNTQMKTECQCSKCSIVANVMLPPARRGDMSGVRPSLSRPVGNPSGLKKRTINERQLMEVCNATPPPLL